MGVRKAIGQQGEAIGRDLAGERTGEGKGKGGPRKGQEWAYLARRTPHLKINLVGAYLSLSLLIITIKLFI